MSAEAFVGSTDLRVTRASLREAGVFIVFPAPVVNATSASDVVPETLIAAGSPPVAFRKKTEVSVESLAEARVSPSGRASGTRRARGATSSPSILSRIWASRVEPKGFVEPSATTGVPFQLRESFGVTRLSPPASIVLTKGSASSTSVKRSSIPRVVSTSAKELFLTEML